MSKRISLKLTNQNNWLIQAIEQERKKQNRPSTNNTIETILVDYFKQNNKKLK